MGTFNKKTYNDKAAKSREIKKVLTHKSNLKRSYLKLLKSEGYDVDKKETETKDEKRPHMSFAERSAMVKQRKEEKRKKRLQDIQAKKKAMEDKSKERERKKERLSQKTKTGQPLMGPRINNLLDKIKNEHERERERE